MMKLKFKQILNWGLFGILGLGIAVVFPSMLVPVILFALMLIVYMWSKSQTKKNLQQLEVPPEVLEDLKLAESMAERRLRENGEYDPYEILWEITKLKRRRAGIPEAKDSGTGIPIVYSESGSGRDISGDSGSGASDDKAGFSRIKRNHNKRLFGRRTRI